MFIYVWLTNSLIEFTLRYISGIIDRKSHEPKFEDAKEIVSFGIPHPYHPTAHQNAIPHSVNVNPLIQKHR
jgi:hypothetical protein